MVDVKHARGKITEEIVIIVETRKNGCWTKLIVLSML